MSTLFEQYELISQSGLFDGLYYLSKFPEAAASNKDPILHYLEIGAPRRVAPSAAFDVNYYLEQCSALGEEPINALLHYIEHGRKLGLQISRSPNRSSDTAPSLEPFKMWLEWPQVSNGIATSAVFGNLTVEGWALGFDGIASVDVHIDGILASAAQYGFRRDDVAQSISGYRDALHCGFSAVIPVWTLSQGEHTVSIVLRDHLGRSAHSHFSIIVDHASALNGHGALRQRMPYSELSLKRSAFKGKSRSNRFLIAVRDDGSKKCFEDLKVTLDSISSQCHPQFNVLVLESGATRRSKSQKDLLLSGSNRLEGKISFSRALTAFIHESMDELSDWLILLAAGDQLGADALLELSVFATLDQRADFISFDEQRFNRHINAYDVFHKPAWSPSLLESCNYLGRAWAARLALVKACKFSWIDNLKFGDFDLSLRLTFLSKSCAHLPKVLMRSIRRAESEHTERSALKRHYQRLGRPEKIFPGQLKGSYRSEPESPCQDLVSIIIPTCASRGLIQRCIESIRATCSDRAIEIICIENIPQSNSVWKKWLRDNTDLVLSTQRAFNWAAYNNLAAKHAKGKFLLFLNDDVEALDSGWLQVLVDAANRSNVGTVGPLLLYPHRTIQHAGLALTQVIGRARHSFRNSPEFSPGYFGLALTTRNVIGVTGACLITRRDTFDRLGGFDETHDVVNNDVDYCFRCLEAGLLNVYTPHAKLIHHELASRGDLGDSYDSKGFSSRWRRLFERGDPYLNPNLSRDQDDMVPQREPLQEIYAGHPLIDRDIVKKILVVKLDHIGDAITAMPALRQLKAYFPDAAISVLSGKAAKSIWALCPEVDQVLEFDYFHVRSGAGARKVSQSELAKLKSRLQALGFDLAIDLRKSPNAREVLRHTGARWLAGFDHRYQFRWLDVSLEWEDDIRKESKKAHVSDDLLNLVHAVDSACSSELITAPRHALKVKPLHHLRALFRKPVICVHPNAGTNTRQWPLENFARLIDMILESGDYHIALLGSPIEAKAGHAVMKRVRNKKAIFNLIGASSLDELPSILSKSSLFIGNNSGPQHFAAGLGTPTIGIHSGVVDAKEWGPLGPKALAIQKKMTCGPCYIPDKKDCPRQMACLTGIAPEDVFARCKMLLPMRAGPTSPRF